MEGRDVNIHITSGSVIKTILFLILFVVLWYLRDIVLVVLTAVVIASSIEPGVRALKRWGFSRLVAVISIYVVVIAIFFGVLFVFVPPVLSDTSGFLQQVPAALSTLNVGDLTHGLLPLNGTNSFSSGDILKSLTPVLANSSSDIFTSLSVVFGGLASFVLIVVFSFYFSVQETGVDDFLRIITPSQNQAHVLSLWKRSQDKIGKWMQGQLILGCIVGVLLYLGLTILGVKYALLLGVLAAVFELIPVFGQILSGIPAIVIAFSTGGLTMAFLTFGLYMIVQQFEAHLIYPIVVKKIVGVPPLLVILALLVGFRLFGFLGVLLSVPIAGAIQELVADIDKQKKRAKVVLSVDE